MVQSCPVRCDVVNMCTMVVWQFTESTLNNSNMCRIIRFPKPYNTILSLRIHKRDCEIGKSRFKMNNVPGVMWSLVDTPRAHLYQLTDR